MRPTRVEAYPISSIRASRVSAVLPARPVAVAGPETWQTGIMPRAGRSQLRWARISIFLTVVSCIKFFVQDNLGFGDFDYTQTIIQLTALGLGFGAAMRALAVHRRKFKIGKDDLLFTGFVLVSICWSWRSWNPNLSIAHAVCYFIVVFNVRVALACRRRSGDLFVPVLGSLHHYDSRRRPGFRHPARPLSTFFVCHLGWGAKATNFFSRVSD